MFEFMINWEIFFEYREYKISLYKIVYFAYHILPLSEHCTSEH